MRRDSFEGVSQQPHSTYKEIIEKMELFTVVQGRRDVSLNISSTGYEKSFFRCEDNETWETVQSSSFHIFKTLWDEALSSLV